MKRLLITIVLAGCQPVSRVGDQTDAPIDNACGVCSEDLHDVLDCDGNVVSHCPDDQGCANGACAPACDAAVANQSTYGCDYFSYKIDDAMKQGGCYAVFVANTWTTPISLTVEHGGVAHDDLDAFARIPALSGSSINYGFLPDGKIPPGAVAILFLDGTEPGICPGGCGCPPGITPVSNVGGAHDTTISAAYHIALSAPVVAYDIFPYGGGGVAVTSASLLLPTSAWKTDYLGVQPWNAASELYGNPSLGIIAQEDATQVTVTPRAPILAGTGVLGTPQDVPRTYSLDRGNVLQLARAASEIDLSGSTIVATKPVAVWGSQPCADIDFGACDSMHQQTPPIGTLGYEYAAVRYRSRVDGVEESVPWKLVGAVDGTALTYEPAPPAGAPLTLDAGQSVTFRDPGPFTVRSQDAVHAFYMGAHMTGRGDPQAGNFGDPEFVNVVAPDQFLKRYVFFTDPTYPDTNLVVVRVKPDGGTFQDVELDCLGTLTGWQPLGTSGRYEFTRVDLVRGDFVPQAGCANGRHEMTSAAQFGVTIWGWGSLATHTLAVSYAYPAGMKLRTINPIILSE